jgi:NADH-quinone oxidoreductase subunit G
VRKAALGGARVWAVNPFDFAFNFDLAGSLVADPEGMIEALAAVARAAGATATDAVAADLLAAARPGEVHRAVASDLGAGRPATVLLGDLALAHPRASVLRALARALAARVGATLGFLPAGGNSAGGWLAGAVPHRGPAGRQAVTVGMSAHQMFQNGLEGFVCLGFEPGLDCWDGQMATRALGNAAFRVALTAFRSDEWLELADVMLPVAAFVESPATYVNGEGRWQGFAAAAAPPGEARPAWKVLRVLGNLLDLPGFEQATATEVRAEVEGLMAAGAEPERDEQWLAPAARAGGGLVRVGELPIYAVDPLVRRAPALQQTSDAASAFVRVHSRLAASLGLITGGLARISQGDGPRTLQVVVDDRVAEGCVWVPCGVAATAGLGPAVGAVELTRT